ncbi:MAG: hypothetical protein H7281_12685 [Bacteriovorax sp.]|nr:hypothetical protein [Bacteriovorax sp.]
MVAICFVAYQEFRSSGDPSSIFIILLSLCAPIYMVASYNRNQESLLIYDDKFMIGRTRKYRSYKFEYIQKIEVKSSFIFGEYLKIMFVNGKKINLFFTNMILSA